MVLPKGIHSVGVVMEGAQYVALKSSSGVQFGCNLMAVKSSQVTQSFIVITAVYIKHTVG